jgi:uncharacterized protein (DUF736 family)
MRIAIGRKNPDDGRLHFAVNIPFLAPALIELAKVENPIGNQPGWNAYHGNERCGAFWVKTPNAGGDPFLSGHIESPLFPGGRLEVAIFSAKEENRRGEKDMVWSPPRERASTTQASTSSTTSSGSTAPAAADDDDDIPF